MRVVKKLSAGVAIIATVAAGFPSSPVLAQARVIPISATVTAPVDQAALISSTIKAFPNGGEPLKIAISDLIVKHPSFAANLVMYLKTGPALTPEQQKAILAGLGDALNRLGVVAADLKTGPAQTPGADGLNLPIILALLAGAGLLVGCLASWCRSNDEDPAAAPSPN